MSQTPAERLLGIAARALSQGKVLVCPTDTIYGLLADATNAKAVKKIFLIKKRSTKKPLGVFVKNLAMAKLVAEINKDQERFLKKVWPGKVTIILKSRNKLAKELGASKTLGLRVPNHGLIQSLLRKLNRPLAQTSVNISNKPPMRNVKDMVALFSQKKYQPDLIVDAGILPLLKPSKVIDYTTQKQKILRP